MSALTDRLPAGKACYILSLHKQRRFFAARGRRSLYGQHFFACSAQAVLALPDFCRQLSGKSQRLRSRSES